MSVRISLLLGDADASTIVLLDRLLNTGKFNGIEKVVSCNQKCELFTYTFEWLEAAPSRRHQKG